MKRLLCVLMIVCLLVGCNDIYGVKPQNESSASSSIADHQDYSVPDINFQQLPELNANIVVGEASAAEQTKFDKAYDLWYNDQPGVALASFQSFIDEHPNSTLCPEAQRMLGKCYSNMDEAQTAIYEYLHVVDTYPDSPASKVVYYDVAHIYYYTLKDEEKAKYYYWKFINDTTFSNAQWYDYAIENLCKIEGVPVIKNASEQLEWDNPIVVNKGSAADLISLINGHFVEMQSYMQIKKYGWYTNSIPCTVGKVTDEIQIIFYSLAKDELVYESTIKCLYTYADDPQLALQDFKTASIALFTANNPDLSLDDATDIFLELKEGFSASNVKYGQHFMLDRGGFTYFMSNELDKYNDKENMVKINITKSTT